MSQPLPRLQFKVTLDGTDPPIWRRLLVPRNATLKRLSDVIQVSMGWTGIHMHRFKQDGREFGTMHPFVPLYLEDDSRFAITYLWQRPGEVVPYEYDFAVHWEHTILLERVVPGEDSPSGTRCVDGARACPPEHCRGVTEFQRLLGTLWNSTQPRHQFLRNLAGREFDPGQFDIAAVNKALSRRARTRMARVAL